MPTSLPSIEYLGRFNRGVDEVCPSNHGLDELNIAFSEKTSGTRFGFAAHLAASGAWSGVAKRVHTYERVGEATRRIILDATNKLWDDTDLTAPILTFAGTVNDFSLRTIFNRAYISPHDGNVGVTGEKVYVYDGTGNARLAAGNPPAGFTLVAVQGSSGGKIEAGHHLFAVAYETSSGHITAPGLSGAEIVNYEATAAAFKCDLSGIPTGPAGTVGRYVIATPVLGDTYNGNPAEQEWFFVPDGHIANNIDTTLTVDFFDADLLESADHLQYQKDTIPAGVALVDFAGRLVVIGDPSSASVPWVSEENEPESISELEGYITVDPGDAGGGVKNGVANRGTLYLAKSSRFYAVTDNGAAPSTWKPDRVDSAVGAECFSIGRILNTPGAMQETMFVADRTGLYLFPPAPGSSASDPLTWKIDDDWEDINPAYFWTTQVFIDQLAMKIYINVALGSATEPSHIFVGDFKHGLDKDNIRWSKWVLPKKPTSIWLDIDPTTKRSIFRVGSSQGTIYQYSDSARTDFDGSNVIQSYIRFGFYPEDSLGMVFQLTEIRLRIRGSGTLNLYAYGIDDALSTTLSSLTLGALPGQELARDANVVSERASIKIETNLNDDWFALFALRLNTGPLWFDRPR